MNDGFSVTLDDLHLQTSDLDVFAVRLWAVSRVSPVMCSAVFTMILEADRCSRLSGVANVAYSRWNAAVLLWLGRFHVHASCSWQNCSCHLTSLLYLGTQTIWGSMGTCSIVATDTLLHLENLCSVSRLFSPTFLDPVLFTSQ